MRGRRCTIATPSRRSSPCTSVWCGSSYEAASTLGSIDIYPYVRLSLLIPTHPQNAFLKALIDAVSKGTGAGGAGTEARPLMSDCTTAETSDGPPPAEGPSPSSVFQFRCEGHSGGGAHPSLQSACFSAASPRCYNLVIVFLWCNNRGYGLQQDPLSHCHQPITIS